MEKTKQKQITDFLINNGVIIVMFILVIVAGLTTQNFFTLNNLNEPVKQHEFPTGNRTWYRRLRYYRRM